MPSPFSSKRVLDNHTPLCERYPPQQTAFPNPEDEKESTVSFRAHRRHFYLPFYIVCDFESFLEPQDDSPNQNTCAIELHKASGFGMYRVTHIEEYMSEPLVYSGEDVVDTFYDSLMKECEAIEEIIKKRKEMKPLTDEQRQAYSDSWFCGPAAKCFNPGINYSRKCGIMIM